MDYRQKSLIKNTSLLFIGNFSSKLLGFFLVPIYTIYISPASFGQVDIYLTILSLLYIVVSLQSIESSFRFVQDDKSENQYTSTITNAFSISLFGICFYILAILIIGYLIDFEYTLLFILFVSTSIYSNMFLHTLRGMGRTSSYVFFGVISTFISVIMNIIFIIGYGLGSITLLITPIIVNSIVILLILIFTRFYSYIKLSHIDIENIKKQLTFSLPLIPNAISIWLLSSIGRFILLYYYGNESVGLLAFALKFPLLLGAITSIFNMAWQISATSEINRKSDDGFASRIFNSYFALQLYVVLLLIPTVKILIFTVMGINYVEVWYYIPIFLFGEMFRSFAQFYNSINYGAKKTKYILQSSIISVFFYAVFVILLAKHLYIYGVAIAYLISESIHWYYAKFRTKKILSINLNLKGNVLTMIFICISLIIYYNYGTAYQFLTFLIGLLFIISNNLQIIRRVVAYMTRLRNR